MAKYLHYTFTQEGACIPHLALGSQSFMSDLLKIIIIIKKKWRDKYIHQLQISFN